MIRKTQCCQDSVFPSLIYRFIAIPIKIPLSYFIDYLQTDSKTYMEKQKDPE